MSACFTLAYQGLSTAQLTAEALLEMLADARQFNSENDITGLLLFGNGHIMQLLEGQESKVRALYGRIELDPQHTAVTLLSTASVTQREFPDWSMAYVRPVDALAPEQGELDINRLEFILGSDDRLFYFKPASAALIVWWMTNLSNPVFAQLFAHPSLTPQEVIKGEAWRLLRKSAISPDMLTYEVPIWGTALVP